MVNISDVGDNDIVRLLLQMSLYFNMYYSPLWLVIEICCLYYKFSMLTQLYKILIMSAIIMIATVEVIRLYLGCMGNLMKKVPELAGFWLLTSFLQFPLAAWILFSKGMLHFPVEKIVTVGLMFFISFEILSGYVALKIVSRQQTYKLQMRAQTEHSSPTGNAHEPSM